MRTGLMVDVECLSLKHNPAILTIGAVVFDPYGDNTISELLSPMRSTYLEVTLDGQVEHYGRAIDGEVLTWWMQQEDEARKMGFHGKIDMPLPAALMSLQFWATATTGIKAADLEFWSLGSATDYIWLENASFGCGVPWGFRYRNQRCLRTLREVSGIQNFDVPGLTKHHAQHDAAYQVLLAQKIMKFLKEGVTHDRSIANATE